MQQQWRLPLAAPVRAQAQIYGFAEVQAHSVQSCRDEASLGGSNFESYPEVSHRNLPLWSIGVIRF